MVPGLSAFTPDFPYFVTKRLTRASGRLMLGRHDVRGAQDDFHVRGSSSREVQRMMNSKDVLRQAVRLAPATARTATLLDNSVDPKTGQFRAFGATTTAPLRCPRGARSVPDEPA